jgi:tRNA-specific 2-thiouridylase
VKLAVAMSGGVDSSVAAALLKKDGHSVCGITMRLLDEQEPDIIRQSKAVAEKIGIPHFVADLRDIFTNFVIDDFCREYSLGRTPNPCVRCNKYIKFGALMAEAREHGADYLATGHYARVEPDSATGRYVLKKGTDRQKDQSYFLCRLDQEQLSRAIFPLGNMTKKKARQMAVELGLPVTERPESRDICFIPDNDYARFLEKHAPESVRPGLILNSHGETIGRHAGLHRYTVGQRKGLGIAAADPLYVTAIEAENNAVIAGDKDLTYSGELVATDLNWIAGSPPEYPARVKARIRYRHPESVAVITPLDKSTIKVKFNEPQMAITPGQTIVFYDGEKVIGGGTINKQGSRK